MVTETFHSKCREEFTAKVAAVTHHCDVGYYGNQDCITASIKTHPEMLQTHKKAAAQNNIQKACGVFIEPSSKPMFADVH